MGDKVLIMRAIKARPMYGTWSLHWVGSTNVNMQLFFTLVVSSDAQIKYLKKIAAEA